MICVLDVTAGPARGRRFWIRAQEKLEIGRISTADFSVPLDRHMSRHHLILEGHESCFRLRDVGSANGTFVNDSRVSTIELCNGDKIKAGETVFEVSVIRDAENGPGRDASLSSASSTSGEGAVAIAEPPSKVHSSSFEVIDSENKVDGTHRSPGSAQPADLDFSHDEGSTSRRSDRDIVDEPPNADSVSAKEDAIPATPSSYPGASQSKEPGSIDNPDSDASFQHEFGFEPSDTPNLFVQRAGALDQFSLTHILQKIEAQFAVMAIIHRQNLRRVDTQLVEALAREGVVTEHGATVCSVLNDCSRDFHLLCESLLGQNSLVLLGSAMGLDPKLVDQIAREATTPVAVDKHIHSQTSDLRSHFAHALDFVLVEVPQSNQLQLLLRN